MKQKLLNLYNSRLNDFKSIKAKYPEQNLNGPFLISPPKHFQPIPLMIIGQETKGWESNENLNVQMQTYEDFNLGINYYSSPFWNIMRKTEKSLGNELYSSIWTNISKYDLDGGRTFGEYTQEISKFDNLLLKEIKILEPKICLFFTGPNFDYRIKNLYENIQFQEILGFKQRQFVQLKHPDLPLLTFRSYHPNYLRRSGLESKFIDFIQDLKSSTK